MARTKNSTDDREAIEESTTPGSTTLRAEHYTFSSERQAQEACRRFRRRGWTASTPWRDQHHNWRVTVLFAGR